MSRSLAPDALGTCIGPAAPAGAAASDALLAALPDTIEPVRRSWEFRLQLALAVFTLLSLLVVYVELVVLTSYGVWSHFASEGFVAAVRRVFVHPGLYFTFCVAGPILCVFLVKPIFTVRRSKRHGVTLDRSAEPRLFAFVDRLCVAQGAPAPRRIQVDTDINASAGLRHGVISLFRDDLVLTVGLPLARAMTLREFTGVLAHEFGHFAHGGAMRLSYLTRMVIVFMLRIAYERDGFDKTILELSRFRLILGSGMTGAGVALLFPRFVSFMFGLQGFLWVFTLFMLGVQGFLWLARTLMKGMAWVGLAACGALLREMEYDADRYEARITGGEAFAAVGDKLAVLAAARQASGPLQERWWQSRLLADDVPALVVAVAERLAARPEVVQEIRQDVLETTTGWFDTHPALRDRLASVAREAESGAITLNAPASALFSDLEGLCKAATLAEYRDMLGFSINRAVVVPVTELLDEVEGDHRASERLARFTQGCPLVACHVTLSPPVASTSSESAWQEEAMRSLETARQRVLDLSPAALEAARRHEETRERHSRLDLAAALIRANSLAGTPAVDLEAALDAKRQTAVDVKAAARDLVPFSEALNDRLRAALRLRQAPHVAAALREVPGVADPARCEKLAAILAKLDAVRADSDRLRSHLALLRGLLHRAARKPGSYAILRQAAEASDEVRKLLKAMREALDVVPYPFPTAVRAVDQLSGRVSGPATVGAWLGSVPTPLHPAGVYGRGVELLSQLRTLEERIISSLVSTAEQVEFALGFPPLPDPPPRPAESLTA
jgi:Zn-dependent protease with chaperone function